jgi:solute carrier family 25 citrate transporter 1
MDVIKETVKSRGIFGLYRGLSVLLLGSVPKAASRFWAYEQARGFLMSPDGKLTRTTTLACGLVAGVTEAIVAVAPMETVKVKLIHDRNRPNPHYKGLFHGMKTIAAEEGIGGLYKGVTATILKQGSNQAIRFYVFGEYTKLVVGDQPNARLLWWQSMIGGVVAGAASVMGNNPFDVIKTNMQGLESKRYTGVVDCARQIFRDGGYSAFYKGALPRMARVCGDVAIVMTMYDQIRQRLEKVPFLKEIHAKETPTSPQIIAGELLYIFRPVLYVICVLLFGTRSFKPWLLSFGVDITINLLLDSQPLNQKEVKEINRRVFFWVFYLLRSPFYQVFLRPGKDAGRLRKLLFVFIDAFRSHYFYISAS